MTHYQFAINGSNLTGALTWNANGTLQQLAITDPFNSADAQNCAYQYDAIVRLTNVNCGSAWAQTFSYDFAGNLKKSGSLSFQSNYTDANGNTNNRYYSGLSGLSYDADGDLLNDSFQTYTWNPFGDLTSIDGASVVHDAFGRMVEFAFSGTNYQLMYAPSGVKAALMTGQTLYDARIPLPGGGLASFGTGGLNNYAHADWLGSTRFSSYTNRTKKWDLAHAPYGEVYALNGNGAEFTFTGQFSDTGNSNTLWDFAFREYHSSQGRWISPDPSGLAAVDTMNPQTWNRYAYVGGESAEQHGPDGSVHCLLRRASAKRCELHR
jgi:RHS repeat-associated protein